MKQMNTLSETYTLMNGVNIPKIGLGTWFIPDDEAAVAVCKAVEIGYSYKAFLRKLGISYIVAGVETLDYEMAMEKLKKLFGIETLMLGGGGVLNWSFIQAGMCDEVSVVIAPVADGSSKTPALFNAKDEWASDTPVAFELQSAEIEDGGSVWLRYLVKR